MATLSDLVQKTVTRLSMVAGISVQTYAEDTIAGMIRHKFIMYRDELWWDDLMDYIQLTCGSDGRPQEVIVRTNAEVTNPDDIVINLYADIQNVWLSGYRDPIKEWPRRANPSIVGASGQVNFYRPEHTKVIAFMPPQTGQVLLIRRKRWYDDFQPEDVVPADEELMINGAAWDYCEDDAANPGQAEKFRSFYEQRMIALKSKENDAVISLSPVGYVGNSSGYQVVS